MTGIVTAPVVIAATNLKKGAVLAIAFTVISMLTIFFCSFVPKKIVYTLRVIMFALVGSIIYIPTVIMLENIFPRTVELLGIYMPLLITNSLIFSKTESRFYLRKRGEMMIDVFFFTVGFGAVCTAVGALRELITVGSIGGTKLAELNVTAFEAPFGGFIMVGIMAGAFRAFYNFARNRRIKQMEELKNKQ
ncbi:MAG: NADH:ubiquinone oxidoreductase subunit RnfE [Eubacterium sp.]|nr:NADH:ubiquinone oxidoreductase subunit RnfE [Eubacterium sp.]